MGRTRVDLGPNDEIGTCRRWPPLASINAVTVWPVVRADEWCSQWKASEEPVYKARKPGRIGR